MKNIKLSVAIILTLNIIALILCQAIQTVSYDENAVYMNAKHLDDFDYIDRSEEEVLVASKIIAGYLRGQNADEHLSLIGLNEKEISHMRDVRHIYKVLNIIKIISAAITLFIILLYAWKKINVFKFKELRNTLFIGYLVPIIFGALYLTDFSGAFVKFHEIFFDNQLWQLDPSTDLLIRLMPEEFFINGFIKILAYYTVSIFVIHICSFYYVARCSSKMKKKGV
ncbi:TIGR01906 family membrane protein [Fenollaria massiliensis]|uniref:TIGR01906 family membrane protein n=1 Tax=Fenollaria massiliensis TaxID=938288 RepID=A0A9E7DII5_9FIRM|nr:TIGR01906 family membrane protein [Fenollaria massiliensis]UQK58605.1 TIGR01906 family membrane protein [Fenollaria massiliensis]